MASKEELVGPMYRTAAGRAQGFDARRNSFAGGMLAATMMTLVGELAVNRWRTNRTRPNIDEEVAAAIAAAEREVAAQRALLAR